MAGRVSSCPERDFPEDGTERRKPYLLNSTATVVSTTAGSPFTR